LHLESLSMIGAENHHDLQYCTLSAINGPSQSRNDRQVQAVDSTGREIRKLPLSQISQPMTGYPPEQSLPDRIPTGSFG
jgi:hypothetical protein